jgi:hypothetical protein
MSFLQKLNIHITMKRFYIFLAICLYFQVGLFSQSCLPDGIYFERQSQVDSFPINYPTCTIIEGNVDVGEWFIPTDITNFYGLSQVKGINGYLKFNFNSELDSLPGFENLEYVGGDIYMEGHYFSCLAGLDKLDSVGGNFDINSYGDFFSLHGLEHLKYVGGRLGVYFTFHIHDLVGLDSLTTLKGDLEIYDNQDIISLAGLPNLHYMGGSLKIKTNSSLTSLNGLEEIDSIGKSLVIQDCSELINLQGLQYLKKTGTGVAIDDNQKLVSLDGLDSLSKIGGYLTISDNPILTSIQTLSACTSINGELEIYSNSSLPSLLGLDSIDENTITDLRIYSNINLTSCAMDNICHYLRSPNGVVYIETNKDDCYDKNQVISICNFQEMNETENFDQLRVFPNPFSGKVYLSIVLKNSCKVRFELFDSMGRLLDRFDSGQLKPGLNMIPRDCQGLPVGVYAYRLLIDNEVVSGKLIKSE